MNKRLKLYLLLIVLPILYSCKKTIENKNSKINYKGIVDTIKDSYRKKDYKKTKYYLKEYVNESLKDNDALYSGKGYHRLGLYYEKFNQTDSAYYFYKKSISFFQLIKDSLRLGKSFVNIAIIESNFGDYIRSDSSAIIALKNLNTENSKYWPLVYNCLGINSRGRKEYGNAIKFYDKAIKYSKNLLNIYKYQNNKAAIYKDLEEYSKSITILKKILNDTIIKNYPKTKARVIDNLSYVRWLQNSQENVLSQFLEAKNIREKQKDFYGLIVSYAHLSDYYNIFNKKKSLEYAYKMYIKSKKEKSPNDLIEALDKIIDKEKPEKAIKFAKERNLLKDSLQLAKDKSQYKYALIKYESVENEKDAIKNKLLAGQQKSQKQLWFFLGLISFLGFISYVFYKRNKTKKEKIIEVYKTETRLAKKIHDELANDMYLAMNKLQKQERKDDSILYDLEKIYSLTRNISHENSPVITGELFEDFLKQLFVSFTTDTCKIMHKGLSDIQVNTLQKEKQIVLYRLLQELLVNMKKHSKANLVVIAFSMVKDTIQVKYKDNGIGTNTLDIKNGLQNMETRIKSVGGTIIFESENEKGFQTKFQFKK